MTILVTDLKYYKSQVVSSDATNGGGISDTEAVSGVTNNVWPHVLKAERDSGSTLYRKLFLKVVTENADTFIDADLWNEAPTEADDYITLFSGTHTDTQATLSEADSYCAAYLTSSPTAGGSTLVVDLEDASLSACFPEGRIIRITDKEAPDSGTGTEERFVILGTPSLSGTELTITIDGVLANSYVSGDKVEGVFNFGDIVGSYDSLVVTSSSSGAFDDTTYPVVINNSGAVTETITMTASDDRYFTVVGSKSGTLSTWDSQGGDYAPTHPVSGNTMFTLPVAGRSGTFVLNDTIVFNTVGAYASFWLKRVVPAGSLSLANNLNITYGYGQA